MNTIRTTVVLAVAGVLAAVTLALAPASSAAEAGSARTSAEPVAAADPAERRRSYYGAIALDTQGTIGFGNNYRTKSGAIGRALRECRVRSNYPGTCRWVAWVRNQCAAAAVRYNAQGFVARVAVGFDFNMRPAKREALRRIGPGGRFRGYVCTTRYR